MAIRGAKMAIRGAKLTFGGGNFLWSTKAPGGGGGGGNKPIGKTKKKSGEFSGRALFKLVTPLYHISTLKV